MSFSLVVSRRPSKPPLPEHLQPPSRATALSVVTNSDGPRRSKKSKSRSNASLTCIGLQISRHIFPEALLDGRRFDIGKGLEGFCREMTEFFESRSDSCIADALDDAFKR